MAAGFQSDYSSLAASMHIGGQPLGVIVLAHRSPGRYGHEAQAMAATFASYAAVAIENARLYDSAQEQAYASAALLQVAQAAAASSSLDETLGTIVRILPILVGVHRVGLYLWDAQRELYLPSHEYGLNAESEAGVWGREFASGKFPLLDAARLENRIVNVALGRKSRPRSWLKISDGFSAPEELLYSEDRLLITVPVSIKNDSYGALVVEEAEHGRRFRARRIEIINGIAQQAALAIQNDRLQEEMVVRERLETEVQLARQIQQTFIPQTLPEFPGWQLAARWRTARQVGGDFYDVMQLPNRCLGLFVADVADKGVPAALFMALTRTLVRAAVVETESPAEALRRVNELLLPDTQQGMFVTAFYAVLEVDSGRLTYTNAGHNPPLWVRAADGEVRRLTRNAVALGVADGVPISENEIRLDSGDLLLLYTDGVTEAFNPEGGMYGEARLLEVVRMPHASAEALVEDVHTRLLEFISSEPLADDLTMLAVRRR
jgi:serine phosphatase RsbU (regulator of sigma subunit)